MTDKQFLRTEKMIGDDALKKLHSSFVVVVGLGAVGSFCCEILARMGVGRFLLIDKDEIEKTNINRQVYALHSTLGQDKVAVAKDRILDIYPNAKVDVLKIYLNPENIETILGARPDVIVDAVDIIKTKVSLISTAKNMEIPIVSSMGAALKSDLSKIKTAKLKKTKNCSLAFVLRKKLRQQGVDLNVPCVYSEELPKDTYDEKNIPDAKEFLGSLPYVTANFGLYLAQLAVCEIIIDKNMGL